MPGPGPSPECVYCYERWLGSVSQCQQCCTPVYQTCYQQCPQYSNTCGGRGGNGATPFVNTGSAGGAAGGGNDRAATAGATGGGWGSGGRWIVGANNVIGGAANIGGTKLGSVG